MVIRGDIALQHNPPDERLISGSHCLLILNFEIGKVLVSFDGMIEPFPAFEMYAIHNGTKPTVLFSEEPPPGSNPWNLLGSPNREVTVVSKEVQ